MAGNGNGDNGNGSARLWGILQAGFFASLTFVAGLSAWAVLSVRSEMLDIRAKVDAHILAAGHSVDHEVLTRVEADRIREDARHDKALFDSVEHIKGLTTMTLEADKLLQSQLGDLQLRVACEPRK